MTSVVSGTLGCGSMVVAACTHLLPSDDGWGPKHAAWPFFAVGCSLITVFMIKVIVNPSQFLLDAHNAISFSGWGPVSIVFCDIAGAVKLAWPGRESIDLG